MKIFLTTSAGSESQLGHALINLNRLTAFGRCPLLSNNGQNVAVPRLSAKCHKRHRALARYERGRQLRRPL